MIALADCNNFYASCERVFQPHLNGKAIVVLSNNDGCIIARSNEAKALGIKMGAPYFKIAPFLKQQGVYVFSSNYPLYGDMSQRVMQTLASFAPRIEIYSIDECFLDFTDLTGNISDYALSLCQRVKQWTGIPISIGIGPSKTLAKLANRLAKSGYAAGKPVLDWSSLQDQHSVLASVALSDIWGISRRWEAKLHAIGINNALQLSQADEYLLRQRFGVVMVRISKELRGIACLALTEQAPAKQQILTSRSFGQRLCRYRDLYAAISSFTVRAGEKLRHQQLAAQAITVFIHTSPFDDKHPHYANSATLVFDSPTQNTSQLLSAAHQGLRRIYKSGLYYQRAGVLLPDLLPVGIIQTSLFNSPLDQSPALMTTLDNIKHKHGQHSIYYASELISQHWKMRQQFKSPAYTTDWHALLTVK